MARDARDDGGAGPAPARSWGLAGGLVLGVAIVIGLIGRGSGSETSERPPAEARAVPSLTAVPTPAAAPPVVTGADTVHAGRALGPILADAGLGGAGYRSVLSLIRERIDPRRLPAGLVVRTSARVPESTDRVAVTLDADRTLVLDRTGTTWSSRLDSVSVRPDTLYVGGVIEQSLWTSRLFGDTARLAPNENVEIFLRLARIYAWQVDFFRDIRPGDAFRVMIRREVRPDGSVRRADVLAAQFYNEDRALPAVRFIAADGPEEYYDADGAATRKAFLRAPLKFSPVTSGFSRRRYHPILHRWRAHRGIDYGANRGTPIHATGAGVVTRAGWWDGYGRMVEVRHNSMYRTRYAHMSGVAKGIHPGVRVKQNQIIGYVGMTGLATAPHLHYEFLVNGVQRDPKKVKLPPGKPVPDSYLARFDSVRDDRLGRLDSLSFPRAVQLASAARAAGSQASSASGSR
ncbi:MAG TPA: M23 family metallopeptidase [Gemmatimonadota bacterium]|nr:M23 family metallopeptidase [Gemmatimonadota bacterium]